MTIPPTTRAELSPRVSAGASCCATTAASAASSTAPRAARRAGTEQAHASALEKIHQRPLLRRHPLARGDQRAAERVAAGAGPPFAGFPPRRRRQLLPAPPAAPGKPQDPVPPGALRRGLVA